MKRIRSLLKPLSSFAKRLVPHFFRLIGAGNFQLGGPRGFYSVWDTAEKPHPILAGQEQLPVKPDCLRIRCHFKQHERQPWPIFWQRISPARLVGPSLAVLDGRKKMMVESVYLEFFGRDDPSYNYLRLPPAAHLEGAWTSVISRWLQALSASYYHWLMDGLPRLALIDQFPPATKILVPAHLTPVQLDTLKILGLSDRVRPTPETHLTIDDYYFSSFTAMTGCDNPYALQFLRKNFLSAASESIRSPEKIYISRLGSARSAHNEAEMIAILEQEGWTIIESQKYTFREQVALFRNTRAVCAIHGAGLTNLVWCPPGCRVLELCAANFLNGCYEGMTPYLALDHRYLVFDADDRYRFKVDLPRFTSALREIGDALARD